MTQLIRILVSSICVVSGGPPDITDGSIESNQLNTSYVNEAKNLGEFLRSFGKGIQKITLPLGKPGTDLLFLTDDITTNFLEASDIAHKANESLLIMILFNRSIFFVA